MKLKRLIAVAFGILEYDEVKFYGKSAVIKYLHEISTYFDETYFIPAYVKNGKSRFNNELDTKKVKLVRLSYEPKKNVLRVILNNLKDQINLIKLITKRSAIIFSSPMIWFTLILPLLPILSGHFSCYVASDHRSVSKYLFAEKNLPAKLKSKITLIFGELALRLSNTILVRGDVSYYKKYGKDRIFQPQPIISLINNYQRREDTCQGENITLLYVGGLYKRKGIDVLLEAFSRISKKKQFGKNLILKIVGDGEEYNFLYARARELGLNEKTVFTGWIDDDVRLTEEYASSDIFVIPSLYAEGFPRVIEESMYYCLPVIATDLEFSSSLRHKRDVYFVKPNSVKELEIAIEELIWNDNLRKRLIKNGRNRMEQYVTSTAHQHAEIIKGTSL